MPEKEHRTPIGAPPDSADVGDTGDFAEEHTDMAVSHDISDHSDYRDTETESPRGTGGMDIPSDSRREARPDARARDGDA